MANYQKGVYEPQDDLHVFDGSEDDEDSEGSRLPLLIVIALFVLASFAGVVWLAYERGVVSGHTEPRTIAAEPGPAKVAANDVGRQEPYKGLKIYEQPSGNENYDGTTVDDSSTPAAPPAKPSKTVPAAVPQTATPKPSQEAQHDTVGKIIEETKKSPAAPAKVAETTPSPPTAVQIAAPNTTSSGYVLQIGSYKTRDEANESWNAFRAKHAAAVGELSVDIKAADLGGKGTWYRLRLGPFADKTSANAACEKIKSAGGNCFLSR